VILLARVFLLYVPAGHLVGIPDPPGQNAPVGHMPPGGAEDIDFSTQ
jgi:hypothetical protein